MKGAKPQVKPPKFLVDLFRDLRDQRLLPLVIVLLAAIPAVSIIFGDPTPAFEAPPPEEGLSAVVADDTLMVVSAPGGLRRHGERFADRRPRDPFVDPNAPETPILPPPQTGIQPPSPIGDDDSDTGDSEPPAPPSREPGRVVPAPPVGGGGGDGGSDGGLILYRLKTTVRFGHAGSGLLYTFEDIDRMRGLPNKQPIAIYIGASDDASRAVFSISADAARVTGAGSCSSGRPRECQFLTLRPGQAANIHDARRRVVWRLAVGSIELVETEVGEVGGDPTGTSGDTGRGAEPVGPDSPGAEPVGPEVVKATSLNEV